MEQKNMDDEELQQKIALAAGAILLGIFLYAWLGFWFLLFASVGFLIWYMSAGRLGVGSQKIVQNWSNLIADAADQADSFFDQVQDLISSREIPSLSESDLVTRDLRDESFGSGTRRFLVVHQHRSIRFYRIYIGVRPYGKELQVSWYLVLQPGFVYRVISRLLTIPHWDAFAVWERLSVFAHQDLHAHASIVHTCVKEVMQATMEKLGQDFSKVDTKSKGILELW